MISLPLAPIWTLEYLCSLTVLILNILSLRLSQRLVERDPENALWLFLNWLAIAFVILSITHMVSHALHDLITYWDLPNLALAQRIFGGFDTVVYVTIAAHYPVLPPDSAAVPPHGIGSSLSGTNQP